MKKWIALLLAMVLCLSLAACGSNNDNNNANNTWSQVVVQMDKFNPNDLQYQVAVDPETKTITVTIDSKNGIKSVTLNGELDYFGQTVNIASRVQELADAGEIYVTDEIWRYPGVQDLLARFPAESATSEIAGLDQPMSVVRISLASEA